jgi:hypothetical protein
MREGTEEEHSDEVTGMYTSEVIGPDGKPNVLPENLTTEQTEAIRATRAYAAAALLAIKPIRSPTPPLAVAPAPVLAAATKRRGSMPGTGKGVGCMVGHQAPIPTP